MRINTNNSSLNTRHFLNNNQDFLEKSMARLSSGKRINSAADDAAGLAITERMTTQIKGKSVALRNAMDGVSLIQTAESALGSISNILQRIRELSVQADNGTYSATDKSSIQDEIKELVKEINSTATKTSFNGINLLDGSSDSAGAGTGIILHIGDGAGETMGFDITSALGADLGLDANATPATLEVTIDTIDVTDDATWLAFGTPAANYTGAQMAIKVVDAALNMVSDKRAELGALQNRLEFTIDNLSVSKINTEASRSRIQDADMAQETSELAKAKILSQSSIAMLSQANSNPQAILQLLQNN